VTTTPNNLANEINRLLQTYSEEVAKEIEDAAKEVAQECRKEIEYHSPHLTGTYERSWRVKKRSKKNKPLYIIYNHEYQLTHLLEHGHAKRGGGRTRAFPHIAPAEENAVREYLDRVERAIET
jgi:hypothetical protein